MKLGSGGKRDGAGRPSLKGKHKKNLTVRLKDEDRRFLKSLDRSYTGAIEKLIKWYKDQISTVNE